MISSTSGLAMSEAFVTDERDLLVVYEVITGHTLRGPYKLCASRGGEVGWIRVCRKSVEGRDPIRAYGLRAKAPGMRRSLR